MESVSIGGAAHRAGVRPSTLRYYERIGLLPRPGRENGRRRYDGETLREALDRLAVVRVAQQAGFKISEIRTLMDGFSEDTPPSERWRVLAQDKLPEVEALVERAMRMKDLLERGLRCECLTLEECDLVHEEPRGDGGPAALFNVPPGGAVRKISGGLPRARDGAT